MNLRRIPGATPTFDADGNERVEIVTCGTCGQSWNDAAISGVTPAPSGRCPFEYEHEDETEEARRAMLADMPAELVGRAEAGEQIWNTRFLQEDFEVLGFMAPFVVVRRRRDGVKGSLQFTHSPRFYFGWEPDA